MNSIILGNGIDIQFGGFEYTNKSIIQRALLNLKTNNFSTDVYTQEIETWIYLLYSSIPDFLDGKYDQLAVLEDEKIELEHFKLKYSTSSEISDIGFEDFFLLNELVCRNKKIVNPNRHYLHEFLRRLFLDSIYNSGSINSIHNKFPSNVVSFINDYDNIFTTNYDNNLESVISKEILYLHGAFHILSSVYDPDSYRNQISDRPVDKTPAIKGYDHVFSTALTGSSGAFKQYAADQQELANSAIVKFAMGMSQNSEVSKQIEQFKKSNNDLVRKLYEAIILKVNDPSLKFSIEYSINRLKEINGKITFVGLSPNNDSHILNLIKNNSNIEEIEFYYFNEDERDAINLFFNNKKMVTKNVKDLWSSLST